MRPTIKQQLLARQPKAEISAIPEQRERRFRCQEGLVAEHRDGFYLRYYTDDQEGRRVRVTEKLCDRDTKHHSVDCAAVDLLRASRMAEINAIGHAERIAPVGEQTVGEFWTRTYLPWAKANLRWSSWHGSELRWKQYLEKHIESRSLKKYKTVDGSRFLTSLTPRLNRNSLGHVRSLASGIFTLALNYGLIERNPWHDVKVLAKVRPPKPKVAYTDEETKAILAAVKRTDAKLFFSLCAVLGLRPSEAAAVKWEDFSTDKIQISRAAPYGHAGETKTEQSKRALDLIEPVKSLVAKWREESGKPRTGWLFKRPGGEPVNHNAFARRYIGPLAKKVCPRWCGCYSGRHGAATELYNSTGDVRAANQVLGNSLQVVMANYIKPDAAQGRAGLKLREAALNTATP